MTQYKYSTALPIKRMPTTAIESQSYTHVNKIPQNQIALVALGGAVTTDMKTASGYIKHLESLLKSANIKNTTVYSVIYSFGSVQAELLKVNLFRRAGRKVKIHADNVAQKERELKQMNENEPIPEYVLDLYDDFIEPRIVAGDVAQTIKNMRNLIFFAHCHGAVALHFLADVTRNELKNNGFDDKSADTILKSIVAIQHNPVGPLEQSPITAINFISASDDVLEYHNDFSKRVMGQHDLSPAFLGEPYGNIFVAGKLKDSKGSEHGFSDGYKADADKLLTENGKVIFRAEQNALINAITAAQNNMPIPTPEQMVDGNSIDFKSMQTHGQHIIQTMHKTK